MGKKKKVTPADALMLRQVLEYEHWTPTEAAQRVGVSPRMMRYYVAGDFPVPQVVWLALQTVTRKKFAAARSST